MTSDQDKGAEPRAGHIFCVSTSLRPECIHIGMTSQSVSKSLKEWNEGHHVGDFRTPNFKLEWSEPVDDIVSVDLQLENALKAFRDTEPGSYFVCAPEDAYIALEIVLGRRAKSEPD